MGNRLRNIGVAILFALLVIFIIAWLAYTISILKSDPQLASAYVATGTLILALVTSFLVSLTWLTIRRSDEREKRDRKERLLNEIIEWAIKITECPFEKDFRDIVRATDVTKVRLFTYNHIIEIKESFMGMNGRSQYISQIALKFERDLEKAVEELKKDLEANIELLDEWQHAMADNMAMDITDYSEKVEAHGRQLDKSANSVIEEATKIKTRDIGKDEHMSKKEETTGSNELTLKDIEEHLKRQDRQTKRMIYFAGAAFGASIVLVAASIWIGRFVLSPTAFYWQYIFLLVVGFGVMFWCWWKQSKVK